MKKQKCLLIRSNHENEFQKAEKGAILWISFLRLFCGGEKKNDSKGVTLEFYIPEEMPFSNSLQLISVKDSLAFWIHIH